MAGAFVDSVGVLVLAGFLVTASAVGGQLLVKAVWVTSAYLLFIEAVAPTAWKLGSAAAQLADQARARGKRLHMGRVNSGRRFAYALTVGCQSVDGTYLRLARHGATTRTAVTES